MSLKQKFWTTLRGKRVDSKQLNGISPWLKNVDFSVNLRSNWSVFLAFLQIPVIFLLAALACVCTYLLGGSALTSILSPPKPANIYPETKLIPYCVFIIFLIMLYFFLSRVIPKTIKSFRKMRRYGLDPVMALTDERPPVLFLRTFLADAEDNPERLDQKTSEELLVEVLGRVGPVIAVGNPEEEGGLPILGAKRIYLDKEWKQNVLKLCVVSSVVVIDAAITRGVLWEMRNVRNVVDPRKVLISFFSKQEASDFSNKELSDSFTGTASDRGGFELFYRKFSESFAEAFGQPLPAYNPNVFLVGFDENWNPYPIIINPESNRSLFKLNITTRKPKRYVPIAAVSSALDFFFSKLRGRN
jgi:hypothetical protein